MGITPSEQAQLNLRNSQEIFERISADGGATPCIVLWLDLLGFRRHMDAQNWELHQESTKLGMKRIAGFHETALAAMNNRYEVVNLNDSIECG